MMVLMTNLLEHAVETVRGLPPDVQDNLARTLLQLAERYRPVVRLTSEERADLAEADEEIERGELVRDEEIEGNHTPNRRDHQPYCRTVAARSGACQGEDASHDGVIGAAPLPRTGD